MLGSIEAAGGFAMAGGGIIADITGVLAPVGAAAQIAGTAIAINGYDVASAGCRQAYSGRQEKAFTQMAAAKASALAGASPETQERISEAVGFAQTIPGLFTGPGELSLAAKAERALSAGEKWTLGA